MLDKPANIIVIGLCHKIVASSGIMRDAQVGWYYILGATDAMPFSDWDLRKSSSCVDMARASLELLSVILLYQRRKA